MKRTSRGFMGYVVLISAFILIAVLLNGGFGFTENKRIEYPQLLEMIKNDQVDKVAILGNSLYVMKRGSNVAQTDFPNRNFDYETTIGSDFIETARQMEATKKGVSIDNISVKDLSFSVQYPKPPETPWFLDFLPFLVIMGVSVLFWFIIMRQQGGGNSKVMNFGKSRARVVDASKNRVTFADVAGADEEKEELKEMVDFLRSPQSYTEIGARIPKGVLLVGPPGTGKTLLAKAVAGEANVPFFTISGSDFVEMFVGVGASRVRDLFEQAKRAAPAIVFIDEIDAVGRHRGAGLGGGHDEREQTLNQLLVEMDGFATNEGVIVMAATNRRDILDPALLRPGRFDRQVTVNYPDMNGRVDILKVHSRGKPLSRDVDFENVAKRMPYATGADLENVMNEAAILAARSRKKEIDQQMLVDAIARVQMGPEKRSHKVNEKDKKLVAYHEAGHAIVAHELPGCDEVHLITIVPRGQAAGHTLALPSEERDNMGRNTLLDTIAMMLGGHAAEQEALDDIYTGSSSDLKRATELVRRMVTQFGMSNTLGTIYLGHDQEVFVGMDFGHNREYSEDVANQIDKEVRLLLDESYEKARKILRDNMDKLHAVANALLTHETLSRADFIALMEGKELPEPEKKHQRTEPEKTAEKGEKPAPKPDLRRVLTGDNGGQI